MMFEKVINLHMPFISFVALSKSLSFCKPYFIHV